MRKSNKSKSHDLGKDNIDDVLQSKSILEDLAAGIEAQKSGDMVKAELIYQMVLQKSPGNVAAEFLRSQVNGAIAASKEGTSAEMYALDACRRYPSHYFAVPPYNLNWMIRDLSPFTDFLNENSIVVADIGARGGHLGEIDNLKRFLTYYAFDADAEECARLEATQSKEFKSSAVLPYYVSDKKGPVTFNLYENSGESSRFEPNPRYQRLFAPGLKVSRSVVLQSATLDDIINSHNLILPDFIKLDTQGSELEIIQASPKALQNALLVESEIELIEVYKGQPLLHDFLRFMHENDFELLYLNRVFQNRANYAGEARGQVTYCDALFGKREDKYNAYSAVQLAKYAILLANYGHLDIAANLWANNEEVKRLVPGLANLCAGYPAQAERNKLMNIDKGLYWQLHQRRTNQLGIDSDRSWPFR